MMNVRCTADDRCDLPIGDADFGGGTAAVSVEDGVVAVEGGPRVDDGLMVDSD